MGRSGHGGITGCREAECKSSSGKRMTARERESKSKRGRMRERHSSWEQQGLEMERGFNPCLSCLEAIVALSWSYQLSHELDLTQDLSHRHRCAANASKV